MPELEKENITKEQDLVNAFLTHQEAASGFAVELHVTNHHRLDGMFAWLLCLTHTYTHARTHARTQASIPTHSSFFGHYYSQSPIVQNVMKLLANLGPVVQSVVSLTSSLRVISLTVLMDSIYNILIFFAEKMWVAFALQKLLTFFQQKISAYLRITRCKF